MTIITTIERMREDKEREKREMHNTTGTLIKSLRRRRVHQNGRDANAAKLRLSIDVSPSVDAFHVRIRDDYADFVTIAPIKWIGDDRRVMKMNA